MNFSKNIFFLRKKKKISQSELAQKLGLKTSGTISRWENEDFYPETKTLLKIAKIFDVNLTELVELNLMEGETLPKASIDDTKLIELQAQLLEVQTELVEILKENRELRKELRNKES